MDPRPDRRPGPLRHGARSRRAGCRSRAVRAAAGPDVELLVDALRGYRGALIVVSHDEVFLSRLDLTETLVLETGGALTEA